MDADSLRLQAEEVESVRWMDFDACLKAVRQGTMETCIYEDELEIVGRGLGLLPQESVDQSADEQDADAEV